MLFQLFNTNFDGLPQALLILLFHYVSPYDYTLFQNREGIIIFIVILLNAVVNIVDDVVYRLEFLV